MKSSQYWSGLLRRKREDESLVTDITYTHLDWPVRSEILRAHQRQWARLAKPGTWLTGAERVAVAEEVRRAPHCTLCIDRKNALSPYTIKGNHDSAGALPDVMVEQIHRIVTDPGRLTRSWYESLIDAELTPESYVEVLGCVATTVAIDTYCRGVGLDPWPLPDALPGNPTRSRPPATVNMAWVPTLTRDLASGTEFEWIYAARKRVTNIYQAMTLVPEEVRGFFGDMVDSHYIPSHWNGHAESLPQTISLPQIEAVATRVSSLNGCFY